MNNETVLLEIITKEPDLRGFRTFYTELDRMEARLDQAGRRADALMRKLGTLRGTGPTGAGGGARQATVQGSTQINVPGSAFSVNVTGKIPVNLPSTAFTVTPPPLPRPQPTARVGQPPAIPATPTAAPANQSAGGGIRSAAARMGTYAGLYGAARLVGGGLNSMVESAHQTARLQQVFRSRPDEAQRLADDTMKQASALGRLKSEAMESAIQWSRMGYNRVQVNEAVKVSLMAANVAEMSAAESTEHLSSLTQVYGLRVQELAGVLGMLNQTSNTFNVTNREMLEGLTRTSAIAKQAGVPLAELVGILGAGIGSTGQTGPNIGNAIKSIIGSISNPQKQAALREGFRLEVTTDGGNELKSFSDILADLFVKYQALNNAERQGMLFTVAGKTQASRMAAILDSYVKGQTLAIQAQLNLNSAQAENEKIVATLKSQFAGLVAEWERFANLQGQNGVSQGLTEVTKGLKNVLSIMNAVPGATSAVGGVMAAVAAKLLLSATAMNTMGNSGGAVVNTLQSIKNAWLGLAPAVEHAVRAFPALDNWARGGPKGGIGGVPMGPVYSGGPVNAGSQAAATAAAAAAPRVQMLQGALALLASTALTVGAAMVVAVVALYGFNKIVEKVGLSSDATDEKLQKLTQSAEAAANAYRAAGQAIKFLDTANRALAKTPAPELRGQLLEGMAEASFPIDGSKSDADKAAIEKRRDAWTKEAEAIQALKDPKERNAAMDKKVAEAQASLARRQIELRANEIKALVDRGATIRSELRKIEDLPFGLRKDRKKKLQEELDTVAAKQQDAVSASMEEQEQSLQHFLGTHQAYQVWLEKHKATLSAISDIYDNLPTFNKRDAANNEVLKQSVLRDVNQKALDVLTEQQKSQVAEPGNAEVIGKRVEKKTRRASALQESINTLTDTNIGETASTPEAALEMLFPVLGLLRGTKNAGIASVSNSGAVGDQIKDMVRQRADLEKSIAVDKDSIVPGKMEHDKSLQGQIDEVRKARDEADKKAQAAAETLRYREVQDRRSIAIQVGGYQGESFSVGSNVGEQLSTQREKLALSISEKELAAGIALSKGDQLEAENQILMAIQQSVQADQNRLKIAETQYDLQKKIHEEVKAYQKLLLGAGPGELLRKLAVAQMSGRPMSSGAFFALGTDARKDFMDRPENSDASRSLRIIHSRNNDLFNKDGVLDLKRLQELSGVDTARRRDLAGFLPAPATPRDEINGAAKAAADLAFLSTSARGAGVELQALGQIVQKLNHLIPQGAAEGPRNAQSQFKN